VRSLKRAKSKRGKRIQTMTTRKTKKVKIEGEKGKEVGSRRKMNKD